MRQSHIYSTHLIFYIIAFAVSIAASHAENIIVMGDDSPPYMGRSLENYGFLPEVISTALSDSKYNIDIQIVPWARAILNAKSGSIDAILGVYFTEERDQYLLYSDPIIEVQTVLFSHPSDELKFSKLSDLSNYRIGIVRGSSYGSEFDNASFLKKEVATTELQNIRKLMLRRIDLIAGAKNVIYYLHSKKLDYPENTIIDLKPALDSRPLYIGFTKKRGKSNDIREKFNKALKAMNVDGRLNSIAKKHGILY